MNDIANAIRIKIFPYCERIELMVNTLVQIYQSYIKKHHQKKNLFPGSSFDVALLLQPKIPFIKNMFVNTYENIAILDNARRNPAEIESLRHEFIKLQKMLNNDTDDTSSVDDNTITEDMIHEFFFACLKYADVEFGLFVSAVNYDNNIPKVIREKTEFQIYNPSLIDHAEFEHPMKNTGITQSIERKIAKLIKDIELNIQPNDKQRNSKIFSGYKQILSTRKNQFVDKKYFLNYLYFNFYRHLASSIKFCTKFSPSFLFLFSWDD